MAIERPASCDLTKGLKKLKNDGWQAAISYHRPQSLNLEICCSHNGKCAQTNEKIRQTACFYTFLMFFLKPLCSRGIDEM